MVATGILGKNENIREIAAKKRALKHFKKAVAEMNAAGIESVAVTLQKEDIDKIKALAADVDELKIKLTFS